MFGLVDFYYVTVTTKMDMNMTQAQHFLFFVLCSRLKESDIVRASASLIADADSSLMWYSHCLRTRCIKSKFSRSKLSCMLNQEKFCFLPLLAVNENVEGICFNHTKGFGVLLFVHH